MHLSCGDHHVGVYPCQLQHVSCTYCVMCHREASEEEVSTDKRLVTRSKESKTVETNTQHAENTKHRDGHDLPGIHLIVLHVFTSALCPSSLPLESKALLAAQLRSLLADLDGWSHLGVSPTPRNVLKQGRIGGRQHQTGAGVSAQ